MKIKLNDEKRVNVITINKLDKIYFDILEKAISTDLTRYFMNYIYYDYENKNMVATDGRRLHIISIENFPFLDGKLPNCNAWVEYNKGLLYVYDIAAVGNSYPNYIRVIPDISTLSTNDRVYNFIKTKSQTTSINFDIARFYCDHNIAINLQYLLDLQGLEYTARVSTGNHANHAIIFINNKIDIVIMPIKNEINNTFHTVIEKSQEVIA